MITNDSKKRVRKQIEFNSLEDLVPKEHLLRKIDKALNFDFIYDEVKELYSDTGALRYNWEVKSVYRDRKQTIEGVFAKAKEQHRMRYTRLRSLAKIGMGVTLIFACMNLKKLANWKWRKAGYWPLKALKRAFLKNIYKLFVKINNKSHFSNEKNGICLQSAKS